MRETPGASDFLSLTKKEDAVWDSLGGTSHPWVWRDENQLFSPLASLPDTFEARDLDMNPLTKKLHSFRQACLFIHSVTQQIPS